MDGLLIGAPINRTTLAMSLLRTWDLAQVADHRPYAMPSRCCHRAVLQWFVVAEARATVLVDDCSRHFLRSNRNQRADLVRCALVRCQPAYALQSGRVLAVALPEKFLCVICL